MTILDIVIGLVLAAYVIQGLRKGFIHETMGLVGILGGVVAGILGAGFISSQVTDILPDFLGKAVAIHLIAFIALFVLFYYLSRKLANLLKNVLENLFLGWLNRLMGAIVAGLKGALILSLAFQIIAFTPIDDVKSFQKQQKKSALYEPLYDFIPALYDLIGSPDKLPKDVKKILEKTKKNLVDDTIDELKREF